MAEWLIEVDTGTGWTDISAAVGSTGRRTLQQTRTLHRGLKSTVNSCRLHVHDLDVLRQIAAQDSDVPIRITRDGARWYTGILRDRISETYSSRLHSGRLEAVDASYRLGDLVDQSLSLSGYAVCSPDAQATSLLHQLLILAGVPAGDLSLSIAVPPVITRFAHDRSGRDAKWRDLLDALLVEYGYVLDVDASGIWRMHDLFPLSVTTADVLTDALMERRGASIQRRRTPARFNAVRVDWHPHVTLEDQTVFRITEGGTETDACRIDLAADGWYPPGTDSNDVWTIWEAADGYELIGTSGLVWGWESEGTVHERTRTLGQTRGLLELQAGSAPAVITQFEVAGQVIARDKLQQRRTVAYRETGTNRIESIVTDWILDDTWASRLASGRATWYEHGSWTYRWDADRGLYALGQVWELDSAVLDHHGLVRVISIREDEWGRQQVTAEGCPGDVS